MGGAIYLLAVEDEAKIENSIISNHYSMENEGI